MKPHIQAVTGHRPPGLGLGYSEESLEILTTFTESILLRLMGDKFITGMAQGFDTSAALACINLGKPFIAAIPCKDQESQWPIRAQKLYRNLLKKAEEVVYVSDKPYTKLCMDARNRWMVDRSKSILALSSGATGGTENCIQYAKSKKVPVFNFWPEWEMYRKSI